MKKILIVSLLILEYNIFGQSALSKGSSTIGGGISFSSYSYEGSYSSQNLTIFTFGPSYGYFILDNLYTGLLFQYTYSSSENNSDSNIGIGPSIRYYFNFEKLNPFLGIQYIYGSTVHKGSISGFSEYENRYRTTELQFSIGADYFINKYFAIEGIVNYSFINRTDTKNNGLLSNYYEDTKVFNIGIGVKYFIL